MLKFNIVLHGTLLSGTDRLRRDAVGRFLNAPDYQNRLAAIDTVLRQDPQFGRGGRATVNQFSYHSLFNEEWAATLSVQMVLGWRAKNRNADLDNLLRDFQNSLAFPAKSLVVKAPKSAQPLYTVVVDDNQFVDVSVKRVADPSVGCEGDRLIADFTFFPPPTLKLMFTR